MISNIKVEPCTQNKSPQKIVNLMKKRHLYFFLKTNRNSLYLFMNVFFLMGIFKLFFLLRNLYFFILMTVQFNCKKFSYVFQNVYLRKVPNIRIYAYLLCPIRRYGVLIYLLYHSNKYAKKNIISFS